MKVTYENKEFEVKENQKVKDILKDELKESTIACKCYNIIKSLNTEVRRDTKLELIDISEKDGMTIYIRGIMYIMGKAFYNLYPNAYLTVNYQLSHSMYCDVENMEITEEVVQNIKKEMQRIIDADIPIKKVTMTKEEGKEFFKKEKTLRGILQTDIEERKKVCLYYCEDYYNYFYGVMPISTGVMKVFDVVKYCDGFLVRYPSKENINKLQPFKNNKKLLSALQEYERIHKVLKVDNLYKLNNVVKEGRAKDVVLLDEALHEKKISQIADNVARNKNIKMVLIAGPSSSGKTTFAQRLGLQLRLNGLRPVTISVDNYFVERDQTPIDEEGKYDFEAIEAIDLKLFNDHLIRLLNGEEIEMPRFNFHTGHKEYNGDKIKLEKEDILVIEGIHCLNDKLTSQVPGDRKYKVYISALTVLNIDYYNRISTTDSRLIRRIVRDYQFRGYSALHTIRMWPSVNRGEMKNIFPYQEEANIMFNTSLIYEISVLKPFAKPLLEAIGEEEPEYAEAQRLLDLLQYFEPIDVNLIPTNSLLREFVGGGDFKE